MLLRPTTLRLSCKGHNGSITELVSFSKVSDIVCLHETWLMSNELGILNDVVPGLSGVGVSAVDISADLLCCRPYAVVVTCAEVC